MRNRQGKAKREGTTGNSKNDYGTHDNKLREISE